MKMALRLAAHGMFTTGTNPRVGCVIVKEGPNGEFYVIGQAYHQRVGEKHAEALALEIAGDCAKGATAYVTLEPCSHVGKNPPCADALINAGVQTVVVCNDDPNPLVNGKGYQKLEQAGIEVIRGVLKKKGEELNRGFIHRMQNGSPWIRSKSAQSLDGRTAMASGESYWITGEKARADVQYWRGRSGAIITSIETVFQDDCRLNFRPGFLTSKKQKWCLNNSVNQPLRVIVDSQLRTPVEAKILQQAEQVLIVTASENQTLISQYESIGVQVITMCRSKNETVDGSKDRGRNQIDLQKLCGYLSQQGINEVLIESGPTLSGAFLSAGLINEIIVYTAPVLMGSKGRPLFELNIEEMSERHHIDMISNKWFGRDQRLRALIPKKV